MPFPDAIFKSYDIRGLLSEITPELATASARALVRRLGAKSLVIGRDMRETSAGLLEAAVTGVRAEGATAVVIGECSTSLFNFAVAKAGLANGGLMITASHLPAEYNGIKFSDHTGLPLSGKTLKEEITAAATLPLPEVFLGERVDADVLTPYVDACVAGVPEGLLSGMTVAVDYGNGMGAVAFRRVAARLGLVLHELYAEPDAHFPHHEANPAKVETLHDLTALIQETGAMCGLAFDGDADRVGIVDELGKAYRGDQVLGLLGERILKQHPGATVVVQPNHSWSTIDALTAAGAKLVMRPIGRTRVVEGMREEGGLLGGEVASHFFFAEFAGLEAVDYAAIAVLRMIAESGQKLSALLAPFARYPFLETSYETLEPKKLLETLETRYAASATSVLRIDGLRCDFARDWWFIARASNTEPILRLTLEAATPELLQEKYAEISSTL